MERTCRDEDPVEELETRRQRLVPFLELTVGEAGSNPAEVRPKSSGVLRFLSAVLCPDNGYLAQGQREAWEVCRALTEICAVCDLQA